ncbi:MAG TPA: hypothetical protein VFW28_13915 [Micropepsaceae bacterium]|nr:hypothetical protein [Micropepsaceae bacterium]
MRFAKIIPMLAVFAVPAAVPLQATAADSGGVCLKTENIQRTEIISDRSILFHMRDGRIWRNDLRTACPMLKVSPYTEKLTTDLICANQQFIHLLLTGNDCALGVFTEVAPQH